MLDQSLGGQGFAAGFIQHRLGQVQVADVHVHQQSAWEPTPGNLYKRYICQQRRGQFLFQFRTMGFEHISRIKQLVILGDFHRTIQLVVRQSCRKKT